MWGLLLIYVVDILVIIVLIVRVSKWLFAINNIRAVTTSKAECYIKDPRSIPTGRDKCGCFFLPGMWGASGHTSMHGGGVCTRHVDGVDYVGYYYGSGGGLEK
jgi:hypothetical protein